LLKEILNPSFVIRHLTFVILINAVMKQEKPPLFPQWWMWYSFVIIWLALLIGGFYLFTKVFS